MNISILTIGSELLEGIVTDTNSNFLADSLLPLGLTVRRKIAVRDTEKDILEALNYLSSNSDIIITTGGLGPTEDDKTRECVAKFLNRKLEPDESVLQDITNKFQFMKIPMPDQNKKQALVIENSIIIPNTRGTAPGFIIPGKPLIAAFPGVPSELSELFPFLLDFIKRNYIFAKPYTSVYFKTIGTPESILDAKFTQLKEKNIIVGTIAHFGQVDIRFDIPESNEIKAFEIAQKEINKFPEIAGKVFSTSPHESIYAAVVKKLVAEKKKVILAESCTGGLISKLITDVPGSSAALLGSFVTYDNILKEKVLQVPFEILNTHGAVSFETAFAMIEGLQKIQISDYYISITGIAGPEGGSTDKPVGTVFIGFGKTNQTTVFKFKFNGGREIIRTRIATRVFEILWQDLLYGTIDETISHLIEKKTKTKN